MFLTCFEPATSEEVRKLILTSPTNTCVLDPIATSLLKSCVDVLLNPITNIVTLSLCFSRHAQTVAYNSAVKESLIIEG